MKKHLAALLWILLAAGCSSIPFEKIAPVSLERVDPLTMVKRHETRLPDQYQLLSILIYEYGWDSLSAIGYIDIAYKDNAFKAVSMNPMGIKLFEISGRDEHIDTLFMMGELSKKGDLANAAGKDIRRIYFDLVPSEAAEIRKTEHEILFRQRYGKGTLEYVFAGAGNYLSEKRYYENSNLVWRISYYEYHQKDSSVYPGGIVLNNYKYGYSLTVRLKEIKDR